MDFGKIAIILSQINTDALELEDVEYLPSDFWKDLEDGLGLADFVATNKDLADIFTVYNNRTLVAIVWTDNNVGDKSVSQSAYITSCEVSAPMEDVTTYSIEFAGTGAPTFATIV